MRTLELNDKEQKCPWCDFFSNFTISCDGIQCGVLLGEVVEKKKLKLKFRKILWVRIPQNNLIMSINTDFFFLLFFICSSFSKFLQLNTAAAPFAQFHPFRNSVINPLIAFASKLNFDETCLSRNRLFMTDDLNANEEDFFCAIRELK